MLIISKFIKINKVINLYILTLIYLNKNKTQFELKQQINI